MAIRHSVGNYEESGTDQVNRPLVQYGCQAVTCPYNRYRRQAMMAVLLDWDYPSLAWRKLGPSQWEAVWS
jgi:hypothetical protein